MKSKIEPQSLGGKNLRHTFAAEPNGMMMNIRFLALFALFAEAFAPKTGWAQIVVSTVAGSGGVGSLNGVGTAAEFYNPRGVTQDAAGNTYVADASNHAIRKISATGVVTTVAGNQGIGYLDSPSGTLSIFNYPQKLVADAAGNVYISDTGNGSIRKLTAAGAVTTFCGSGRQGYADGPAALARFDDPTGLALDPISGNLYVADGSNYRIRRVDATGTASTLAGSGIRGFLDGPAASARFMDLQGIALDQQGNLYIADRAAHRIRKLSPAGLVSTVAGTGIAGYVDGPATTARFNSPTSVALDAAGALYVMDRDNQRIRRIAPNGLVSTVAGSGQVGFSDRPAASAQFNGGYDLLLRGNSLLVADAGNHRIRQVANLPLAATPALAPPAGLVVDAYPNPGTGPVTVSWHLPPPACAGQLRLYSPLGQLLRAVPLPPAASGRAEVGGLPPGLYLARLVDAGGATQGRTLRLLVRE